MERAMRVTLFFLALCKLTCTCVPVSLFYFVKALHAVLVHLVKALPKVFPFFHTVWYPFHITGLGSIQSTFGALNISRRRFGGWGGWAEVMMKIPSSDMKKELSENPNRRVKMDQKVWDVMTANVLVNSALCFVLMQVVFVRLKCLLLWPMLFLLCILKSLGLLCRKLVVWIQCLPAKRHPALPL